jgi:outer membrane protein OmpA-like peptidoglycan-associated protein
MSDLYEFVLDEKIRPKIATFLRGITRDSASKVAVQAKVYLIDVETRDTLREMFTGKADGKFLMSVPLEREYAVFAEAPGYIFASKNFYLKNLEEDIYFDVIIDMEKFKPTVAVATPANPNPEPAKPVTVILQNVFFESAKYDLMPTSFVELDVLFGYMEKNPKMKIEVQGHTDNVGDTEKNLTLSQDRANAVRDYLVGRGIEEERITSMGYGESQPIESNDTPQGRAKNRRTAFVILAY